MATSVMSAAQKLNLISVEDYLAGELDSAVKHEYLGGNVYAMAGGRNSHNRIVVNLTIAVGKRLLGHRCQPSNSDTKIHIELPTQTRFYYPDFAISCESNPASDSFEDKPVVIFEVLSKSTRRIDEGEKKEAYFTIPSLKVYALVEQELPRVVVYRRKGQKFVLEVYENLAAIIPLPEVETEAPLAEIYAGAEFTAEVE